MKIEKYLKEGEIEKILDFKNSDNIPKVTVTIPLYNYMDYIIEALESVKNQTLDELDLIIVDDCSTDDSLSLATNWLKNNSKRFRRSLLLKNKFNKIVSTNKNIVNSLAETKYIFPLDADNKIYSRCLSTLLLSLENAKSSFAYCYIEKFGKYSGLINTKSWNPDLLQYGNYIDGMVLLEKKVWEEVGGYSLMDNMGWEDFDLWFKIARMGGWGVQVPEILAKYRIHTGSFNPIEKDKRISKLWTHIKKTHPDFFTNH